MLLPRDIVHSLGTRGKMMKLPELFKAQMKELLGAAYDEYLKSYEQERFSGLRVNTAKISVKDFLAIAPFELIPIPWTENGFYYSKENAVTKHSLYHAGLYYIQEPSAMLPAACLPIEEGDFVLDLCAAPGGKATELGAKLKGTGLLVANDISNSRAKGLLKNLELFGLENILVTSETPEHLCWQFHEFFDKILVDAPCSGEGMFRKEPTMIRDWEVNGPDHYAKLQREILTQAWQMLRQGGMLLYSTCTFSPLENEKMIEWILAEFKGSRIVPLQPEHGIESGLLSGVLRAWPHKIQGEGHFIALLQKGGEEVVMRNENHIEMVQSSKSQLPKEATTFFTALNDIDLEKKRYFLNEERVYLLPIELPMVKKLRLLRTGLYLGDCKKKRFEPSQALAMTLNPSKFERCFSLKREDERVIRYLKGETLVLDEAEMIGLSGWVLVCLENYPLGWAKMVNGTLRNKYYPGWRLQ